MGQRRNGVGHGSPEGPNTVGHTSEWTLWVVAASCAVHPIDEYLSGWQPWALDTLGINMPTPIFVVANIVLVILACVLAAGGWRRPAASLLIPGATLANGVLFHVLPTILQQRIAPGLVTAVLLYVPFSAWAFVGAWRAGVPKRSIAIGLAAGSAMMLTFVATARFVVTPGVR